MGKQGLFYPCFALTTLTPMHKICRVDQGSYLPRPPTDPDVRDYRIRLLRSRLRSLTVNRVDNHRWRQRVTALEILEPGPADAATLGSPR